VRRLFLSAKSRFFVATPKLSRKKELKAPDAFQKEGAEVVSFMQKYPVGMFVVGILVIVAVVGALIAGRLSSRHEEQAAQQLGSALEPASRPVAEKPTEPGQQVFPTQKDKDEALVTSLEAFRKQYPGTQAAAVAALSLGQAQLRLGNADPALPLFDEFLRNRPATDPLRVEAYEGQGYAYEAKGQLDQALQAFSQMAQGGKDDFMAGMGQFHQGRVLIKQGKKDEAAKLLSQIPAQFPGSAAAHLAEERLADLASQGVKVPAPVPATEPAKPGQGA
jgi:tetratricopeptide (TPR) repeat protein